MGPGTPGGIPDTPGGGSCRKGAAVSRGDLEAATTTNTPRMTMGMNHMGITVPDGTRRGPVRFHDRVAPGTLLGPYVP